MTEVLLIAGVVVQIVAWRLAATGRTTFWPTAAATWAVVGSATVLVSDPRCCVDVAAETAVGVGLVSGAILYGATRAVVAAAVRVPILASAVEEVYGRGDETSPGVVWAVTILVVVPAEELFWRGVALPELQQAAGPITGALLAWAAGVAVTAAWASLPFLAAAVVGGALWTFLGVWSGGIVAPLASHAVWTAAMLAWRPGTGRAKVPG